MLTRKEDWLQLSNQNIAAIKFNLVDRYFLLLEIAKYCEKEKIIYFWNPGYKFLQKVNLDLEAEEVKLSAQELAVTEEQDVISACYQLEKPSVLVIEGVGRISQQLSFQLRNFYFADVKHQIVLVDDVIQIPLELYSLIRVLELKIPNVIEIREFLLSSLGRLDEPALPSACFGLALGELKILVGNQTTNQSTLLKRVTEYKTGKLVVRGLRIVPQPDVDEVGGLDELERDLLKIKQLFTPEAASRGLRPPKGCLLWGLPGTGKSLVSKMMSRKLNATLIACDWNELISSDLASSLAKLQYVLDVVDNIGEAILFFDEFEKAFAGWNSELNGGILAKMASKLLIWLQDHQSPSIMLATINHLDMLPPELIRRFEYIWFFPSELHNGAMWEVFKIHLSKHFSDLHQEWDDTQWRQLFLTYRGCSPAEIAGAVQRVHDELFFTGRHLALTHNVLFDELKAERTRFKPAISNRTTSNALAKILMEADFARPVRGEDRSRFAVTPRGLFEEDKNSQITLDEYQEIYHKIMRGESKKMYSFNF